MSQLTIYFHPFSPYARAVLSLLYDADVQFNEKFVNLFAGEQKKEEYLKINPEGKVPALVDGDYQLAETPAILKYIVRTQNINKNYYPENDAKKAGYVDFFIAWFYDAIAGTFNTAVFKKAILPKFGIISPEEEINKLVQQGCENLKKLSSYMKGDFLAGANVTIADFFYFCAIQEANFILQVDLSQFPIINDWFNRVKALKGPAKTSQQFYETMSQLAQSQHQQTFNSNQCSQIFVITSNSKFQLQCQGKNQNALNFTKSKQLTTQSMIEGLQVAINIGNMLNIKVYQLIITFNTQLFFNINKLNESYHLQSCFNQILKFLTSSAIENQNAFLKLNIALSVILEQSYVIKSINYQYFILKQLLLNKEVK